MITYGIILVRQIATQGSGALLMVQSTICWGETGTPKEIASRIASLGLLGGIAPNPSFRGPYTPKEIKREAAKYGNQISVTLIEDADKPELRHVWLMDPRPFFTPVGTVDPQNVPPSFRSQSNSFYQ